MGCGKAVEPAFHRPSESRPPRSRGGRLLLLEASEVSCDQDLFVVGGVGGHELVDQLVSLPGQSDERGDVGFRMTCVASELLLVLGPINRAVLNGHN